MTVGRRRKFWGWGYEGEGLDADAVQSLRRILAGRFHLSDRPLKPLPRIDDVRLPEPRVVPPQSLSHMVSSEPWDRAEHTYGKAYQDLIRGFHNLYEHPPDLVAFPKDESEITALLNWCADERIAAIPYGGGSGVVGGTESDVGNRYTATLTIDLRLLSQALEVDQLSRTARIQAGVLGPELEKHLKPYDLTLRFFPQSFEMSSLGGWIATRAAGHYAVLNTHIEESVESLRAVTPRGIVETRRYPNSGAGPAPERLFAGSEGTLGIITEAWVKLQERPKFKATRSVGFSSFDKATTVVRNIAQSGLYPANCRLLDADQVAISGSGDGMQSILILGFESADHEVAPLMERALEICREGGGNFDAPSERGPAEDDPASRWRTSFIRAGHTRDVMMRLGILNSTFETCITWDRFPTFHEGVLSATKRAVKEVCGDGVVCCRFAYSYPDGPAPYYTVIAPVNEGDELRQWKEIKDAASEAVLALGGTITHHHAIGRYHRPWYDRELPTLFTDALRAAKSAVDPAGIMNPGVLIDPAP